MRSEAQRQASRINGAKSRGPKTPGGKAITRFNGLTHTLCAAQAVLPGEDPAQFQAHRDALFDDWQPMSYTRALLVERVAIASWRLRRAPSLSEASLRGRAADDAVRAFDGERQEPSSAPSTASRTTPAPPSPCSSPAPSASTASWPPGASWTPRLEGGPAGWSQRYHRRLMLLLGAPDGTDLITAGPLPTASARLLASRKPGVRPLPAGEAEESVAGLRRLAAQAMDRLRDLRRHAPDTSGDRRRAAEAASGDVTAEAQLRHRYEMALDRSLRGTIYQLLAAAERSGARPAGARPCGRDARGPGGVGPGGAGAGAGARSRGSAGRSGDDRVAAARPRAVGAGFARRRRARVDPEPRRRPVPRPGGPVAGPGGGRREQVDALRSTHMNIRRDSRARTASAPRAATARGPGAARRSCLGLGLDLESRGGPDRSPSGRRSRKRPDGRGLHASRRSATRTARGPGPPIQVPTETRPPLRGA